VQEWADLTAGDGRWGVTWSSQLCAHTLHVDSAGHGTGLSPLLLRTAYSCGTPFLWYTLEGRHTFRFALAPHDGTWQDSHSWRLGWEHHYPLAAQRLATARPLAPLPGRDVLPERLSFCTLDAAYATVGTIHQPEAGTPAGTYAVRLVEVEGRGGSAGLTFCRPVRQAVRTNLVGDGAAPLAVDGNRVAVGLGPYEIATVQVSLAMEEQADG
jgi:alpha-mannosidase